MLIKQNPQCCGHSPFLLNGHVEGDPGFGDYEQGHRKVMAWDDPPEELEDGLSAVRQVWWPETQD